MSRWVSNGPMRSGLPLTLRELEEGATSTIQCFIVLKLVVEVIEARRQISKQKVSASQIDAIGPPRAGAYQLLPILELEIRSVRRR